VVIDRTRENVIEVVKSVTGGKGADVVYDPVGGDAFAQSIKCIAFEGRIVIVGFASGQIPSSALNHALVKNYSILGLHWGLYQTKDPALIRECHAQLVKLAADGLIKPLIGERLGLADVPAGVQRLADGETIGRIVFQP
jgi:NADPH:quinone reductase